MSNISHPSLFSNFSNSKDQDNINISDLETITKTYTGNDSENLSLKITTKLFQKFPPICRILVLLRPNLVIPS